MDKLSNKTNWLHVVKKYGNPAVVSIFFLGITSGLPFLLLLSTLNVWLTEVSVTKTQIGFLAWLTLPYALKFLFAPFFEKYSMPVLGTLFGRVKGWLLIVQLLLIFGLIALGQANPSSGLMWILIWGFVVCLFSACQDILVDGFRIVSLPSNLSSIGASASVVGYRIGMMISGAGAVFLSNYLAWAWVYNCMAVCVLIGMITVLSCNKIDDDSQKTAKDDAAPKTFGIYSYLFKLINWRSSWVILLFILFFKAGDTIMNSMNMPFLLELGFSKTEIAQVAKTFGICAMTVGGFIGGLLLFRFGLMLNLTACLLLQCLSCVVFAIQAYCGCNLSLLWLTMGIENFVSGMSQTVLITYLTSLCTSKYPISQFALLASLASLCRIMLTSVAGYWADIITWELFYLSFSVFCLPGLYLLKFHPKTLKIKQRVHNYWKLSEVSR